MDAGILRALKTVKNNPYIQYVGLGLAGLVTQKELCDQQTGKPHKKTKIQLIRISAAVCGIELCYAAETAFVSPILLKLGVPTSLMTMVWCLSPVLGFFLVPVMGSLSDRCRSRLGRRRPFIILLSIGIILGLALVPNGEALGVLLGDCQNRTASSSRQWINTVAPIVRYNNSSNDKDPPLIIDMKSINKSFISRSDNERYESPLGVLSFSLPAGGLRGIILTIIGVAMLDFNCDACQSPCRAYLLDVSLPEDHSTGLTMFTVMAGAGGAVGYLMGGIDWNATSFGEAFGGHIRIVFTIVLLAFFICVGLTLTSFREVPLSDLNVSQEVLQRKKKRKDGNKYRKFTNEDSFSTEEESDEIQREKQGIDPTRQIEMYGSLSQTSTTQEANIASVGKDAENRSSDRSNIADQHMGSNSSNLHTVDTVSWLETESRTDGNIDSNKGKLENGFKSHFANSSNQINSTLNPDTDTVGVNSIKSSLKLTQNENSSADVQLNRRKSLDSSSLPASNGTIPGGCKANNKVAKSLSTGFTDEINPYAGWTKSEADDLRPDVPEMVQVSTDITLKTYLTSIVRMPRCLWILCLCNLLCWMSLVCYSLYFTDFVGQAVFDGNPQAKVDSDSHIRYDQGVRLGSFGMSLYSLACAGYSMVIERLVNRFRAKKVYVIGQLVFTVGMTIMAATRHKVAVILLSPSAGIMYATLFTMPYLLVAHYHTRGLFSHGDLPGSGGTKQVRGLGTDVAIISSMVFLAQFLLSVVMGTLVSLMDSTVTVMVASSVLSLLGALTATQVTYLDL